MTTTIEAATPFRGRYPNRITCQLPADTDGTDHQFTAAGFEFGDTTADPLYRDTVLPVRWHLDGTRILDEFNRERVCVYAWQSLGAKYAHMHLTDLAVYLRGCVARGERPLLDPEWASRKAVLDTARVEVERITGRIDELTRKGPAHQIATEYAHKAGFADIVEILAPAVAGAR